MSNAWVTRSPRDHTGLQLRKYRLQVREEFVGRHGRVPTLAEIDALLRRAWYRLPEDVADRVMMFVEMRQKQAARRAERAHRSAQARSAARQGCRDVSEQICVAPALI